MAGLTPSEILRRDAEQAQRFVQGAGHARTMGLLQKAQAELNARLKRAEGLGGPGKDSFTVAQLRATLAQVRAVTAKVQTNMKDVVVSQGRSAAERSAASAVQYLSRAERHFKGSTERLNLDPARLIDRAVAGTNSSILNRLLNGPDEKKRGGILQRYGENVVSNFEQRLQQRLIQRTPLAEVRQQLVDDSPFLQGAPGHWAERIVRTETMHAENNAALDTIHQANEQLGDMCKIISSVFDARTGADSFAVHGQIRRPNESFQSWFGSYMAPPDRPNDRSVVVPHRISWPIPAELKPKSDGAVAARWSAEGRKGSPPARPLMTTIPLEQFGKPQPLPESSGAPSTADGAPAVIRTSSLRGDVQPSSDVETAPIMGVEDARPITRSPLIERASELRQMFADPWSNQRSIRSLFRDQVSHSFQGAVSKDVGRTGGGEFVVTDLEGAYGTHNWNGTIALRPEIVKSIRSLTEMVSRGDFEDFSVPSSNGRIVLDEHAPKKLAQKIDGLAATNIAVHEELHGHSRATRQSYRQEMGRVLEEVGTELSARQVTLNLSPEIAAQSEALNGKAVYKKVRGKYQEVPGLNTYQSEISDLSSIVAEAAQTHDAAPFSLSAARQLIVDAHHKGVLSDGPEFKTAHQHLDAFVGALDLSPAARAVVRQRIIDEFGES